MTNQFWIAANIIFNLGTGETTQVLMLVNRESDATIFETEKEARDYLAFVKRRAENIEWFLESKSRLGERIVGHEAWIIRGVQTTPAR